MTFLDQASMISLMMVSIYVYFSSGKILVTNIGKLITGGEVSCWTCLVSLSTIVLYTSTYFIMCNK